MKRIFALVIMLLMLLCVFCGCGDTADENERVYIIGTDTEYSPFGFYDDEGKAIGIDVEIIDAVARKQGFKYELKALGADNCRSALENSEIDGIISGLKIDESSKGIFDFSSAYFESGIVLAVVDESGISAPEGLKKKKVGVINGSAAYNYAVDASSRYGFNLVEYGSADELYSALDTGKISAVADDSAVIGYKIKSGDAYSLLTESGNEYSYGFAVMKGENGELRDMFANGLDGIKSDGTYKKILDKYTAS